MTSPKIDPKRRRKFRAAAAVVMIRGRGDDLEVYWVKRSQAVPMMPGFYAFVGGGVEGQDADLVLEGSAADPDDALAARAEEDADPEGRTHAERLRLLRACAIREAFEETGVLLGLEGSFDPAPLSDAQDELLAKRATFPALAVHHGWRFRVDALTFAGRWMTPAFSDMRFDTLFFLARVPDRQAPSIKPGELESGEWIRPRDAIEKWKRGEATFAAPILMTLEALAAGEDRLAERLAAAPAKAGQPVRRIELNWGIVLQPMKTLPLPPASRTNAYLVGEREMALIDPGSGKGDELEPLFRLIDSLDRDGRRVKLVLLTHHHFDHVEGAPAVAERHGVPIAAHRETARLLAGKVKIDRLIEDGETIELDGPGEWNLRAILTPGHAPGHLCFLHERTKSLFVGDQLTGGRSTVIIDPPEGDMAAYIGSLERLLEEPIATLFPAHGSPNGAAKRSIQRIIKHRLIREEKVLAALTAEPLTLTALVPRAYDDTPSELWGFAERSLLAHLLKLEGEGKARQRDGEWRLA